jgi:hypothetical protein
MLNTSLIAIAVSVTCSWGYGVMKASPILLAFIVWSLGVASGVNHYHNERASDPSWRQQRDPAMHTAFPFLRSQQ